MYNDAVKKTIIFILISIAFGIGTGLLYLQILPNLPAPLVSPLAEVSGKHPAKVFGFLPYWLLDKAQHSYSTSLTTLAYFSLGINADGTIRKLVNDREEEPGWTSLRKPEVIQQFDTAHVAGQTTSLVIFSGNQDTIDTLIHDPVAHAHTLVQEILPIMQEYKFDDVNLDLESSEEASLAAQQQFTDFVQTVKNDVAANKLGTVSFDMTVASLFQQQLVNPVNIGKIADTIILMTYDYHYPGSLLAGPVSPLGGVGITRVYDVTSSLYKAMQVIPREKIVLGLPLYGYEWQTLSNIPGSPSIPNTGQTASDMRVEQLLSSCTNCIQSIDNVSQEPYVIFPDGAFYHQIYYTDGNSTSAKVNLARSTDIGGVALWALGYEGQSTLQSLSSYKRSLINSGQ